MATSVARPGGALRSAFAFTNAPDALLYERDFDSLSLSEYADDDESQERRVFHSLAPAWLLGADGLGGAVELVVAGDGAGLEDSVVAVEAGAGAVVHIAAAGLVGAEAVGVGLFV